LVEAATQQGLAIHAYVLMTHHIHVLATPESGHAISQVFQSVGRRYVHYFNATYGRSGTLWEGLYRATVVDSQRFKEQIESFAKRRATSKGLGRARKANNRV